MTPTKARLSNHRAKHLDPSAGATHDPQSGTISLQGQRRWCSQTTETPVEALLDQIPLGVVLVRARTSTVVYANPRAEEIVGRRLFDPNAPIPHTELAPYRADRTRSHPEEMLTARVLRGEGALREESLFMRPDGRLVATRAAAAPICDKAGRVISVVLLLDEAIGSGLALADSGHHEHERDFFVGMLGHDLRAPLASILSGASLMHLRGDLPLEHMRIVRRVISSAERMSRMVDRTLEFARTRLGGGIPLVRRTCTMRQIVQTVVNELPPAERHRVTMDLRGVGHGLWDGDRIAQVVSNLVANALQHGDPATAVSVSLQDEPKLVRLQVHNSGRPIPRQLLTTIFDPFRRPSAGVHGIGLGLTIAHEIVRAHDGTVAVESTEEHGTVFTVCLPR